ncbi:MAG: acylphosphatase [Candidatus Roizmanbacteria bacterium]|nr:acylphosphatase [Candidatus Roizmanbacteria bacterium]
MHIRLHIFISGHVQGVGFRYAARVKAHELHIAGWIKNRDDMRVEAVFEGPKEIVEKMVHWCYSGSPGNVEQVVHIEEDPEGIQGFYIRS